MRIFKRKGSPHWWVTWNDRNGKRHRRSSGTEDWKLAEALAAKWVKADFLETHFGKKPDVPFSEALLRYAKTQKRDSPERFTNTTRHVLKRLTLRFKDHMLSDFDNATAQKFVDDRLATVSVGTVLRDVSTLKAILNRAKREGLTDKVPTFPKLRTPKPRRRWITRQEEERLLNAAADHLKPLIRIAVDTGGRLSELLGLDWRDVDLGRRQLTFVDTKNGEDRAVRLTERACATLNALGPKDEGAVFTYHERPIASVKTAFNRACERAGIADLRFHDLRHTFASRLVQGGVPLYEVMNLTGHKSLAMVQRYAHLAPDYQEGAIRVLDDLGHNSGTERFPSINLNDAKPLREMVPPE